MQEHIFFGLATWGPGEGPKGQISLNFNYKVNFKDFFKLNFVCLLTNKRYKTYQAGFSFGPLGHAPGVGLRGVGEVKSVSLSVTLSLPKPLDEIQPNLVCELLTETKLFNFHRIFKITGREGGFALEPPIDPPLYQRSCLILPC